MSRIVPLPSFALILLSLLFSITTIAAAQPNLSDFQNCPPSYCNDLKISYPFWKIDNQTISGQFCGYEGLGINCSSINGQDHPMMYLGGHSYYVRNLNNSSITLVDDDVFSVFPGPNECPRVKHGIDLENLPLNFTSNNLNLSFHFNCNKVPSFAHPIPCFNHDGRNRSCVNVISSDTPNYSWGETCEEEVVTTVRDVFVVPGMELGTEFVRVLSAGFELNWTTTTDNCTNCEESDGLCGYSTSTGFICFCSGGTSKTDHCKKELSASSNSTNFMDMMHLCFQREVEEECTWQTFVQAWCKHLSTYVSYLDAIIGNLESCASNIQVAQLVMIPRNGDDGLVDDAIMYLKSICSSLARKLAHMTEMEAISDTDMCRRSIAFSRFGGS